MSSEIMDCFVGPEDIKAANEVSSFLLQIPPDAARKGDPTKPGGKASWQQSLNVVTTKMENTTVKNKEGVPTYPGLQVEVEFQVPPDGQRLAGGTVITDPNAGRTFRKWFTLVPEAAGNREHAKYKSHYWQLGRLKGLLVSAGYTIPEGGFSVKAYFGDTILNGVNVNTIMTRSFYEGKPQDEISDFLAPQTA